MATPIDRKNIKLLEAMSSSQLQELLIGGYRTLYSVSTPHSFAKNNPFKPLLLPHSPESAVTEEFVRLHKRLSFHGQEVFRDAVVKAITKLIPDPSTVDSLHRDALVLSDMAYLSERARFNEVTTALRAIIEENRAGVFSNDDFETVSVGFLLAISSFATFELETNLTFFEKIYNSLKHRLIGGIDDRFAGHVLIGLCQCKPQACAKYLLRYFDILERSPELVLALPGYTLALVADLVSLSVFVKSLDQLASEDAYKVLYHMCAREYSPFLIEIIEDPLDTLKKFSREYIDSGDISSSSEVIIKYSANIPVGFEERQLLLYDAQNEETFRYLDIAYSLDTGIERIGVRRTTETLLKFVNRMSA